MDHDWAVVFRGTFLPKVELLKALLSDNEIPSLILNQQDSTHRTFGEIMLYVRKEDFLKAFNLISTI